MWLNQNFSQEFWLVNNCYQKHENKYYHWTELALPDKVVDFSYHQSIPYIEIFLKKLILDYLVPTHFLFSTQFVNDPSFTLKTLQSYALRP